MDAGPVAAIQIDIAAQNDINTRNAAANIYSNAGNLNGRSVHQIAFEKTNNDFKKIAKCCSVVGLATLGSGLLLLYCSQYKIAGGIVSGLGGLELTAAAFAILTVF